MPVSSRSICPQFKSAQATLLWDGAETKAQNTIRSKSNSNTFVGPHGMHD